MKLSKELRLMDRINAAYQVGDKIKVKQDDGEIKDWTVSAPASMLGDITAVIWCEEHRSCYLATRVVFE